MPYRVLVFEDHEGYRSIMTELSDRLASGTGLGDGGMARSDHPRYDFRVSSVGPADLSSLAATRTEAELAGTVSRLLDKHDRPDLVVLDLALDGAETTTLEEAGGTDPTGTRPADLALERTTGFRILKHLAALPISDSPLAMVTTLASNPRVVTGCLEAGAFSVVIKPASSSEMPFYWDLRKPALRKEATKEQLAKADALRAQITAYLLRLESEVLKSLWESVRRRSAGHAPGPVPFWAVHERPLLEAGVMQDTNLLLMDVRGFSRLVALGVDKPSAVFNLMNMIWDVVLTVLDNHKAEVNNFIGDAALVFRGVYERHSSAKPTLIEETLLCARELCGVFALDGVVRKRLLTGIEAEYGKMFRAADNREQMFAHVKARSLGLRVVIADPDEHEALYGAVGNLNRRWQHTILSRFMNALARAESAVGKWEKEGLLWTDQDASEGAAHCFLLWDKKRPLPVIAGTRFETPEEYLGRPLEQIRDVPDGMNIFRVRWETAPKPPGRRKEAQPREISAKRTAPAV